MAKDIVGAPIGSEGSLKLKVENGKIIFEAKHAHASGSVAFVIEQSPRYFAEQLKAAIPGAMDDFFIDRFVEAVEAL